MSQARKLRRQLAQRAARAAMSSVVGRADQNLRAASASPSPSSPNPLAARKLSRGKIGSEVCIDGVIGEKNLKAANIREALAAMGPKKDITLRINSVGGSVVEGIAMYQALRRHEGNVCGYVDGIAASMASVILQAADERHVSRGSYVMIHNPSSEADGEAGDLRATAELLDKIRDDMLDIYEARTGLDRAEIRKMMDAETYLNADEAVKLGFADVVDETEARIDARAVAKLSETSKKIPEALKAKAAALAKGKPTMTDEEEKEMKALREENAKLKAAAAKAEDDEDEGSEEEEASAEGDDEPHDEDDDDKKEAKAVLAAARRLTGKKSAAEVAGHLMALANTTVSARAAEVKALIDDGKLAPKDRKWALSASDKTFSAYKSAIGTAQIAPIGKVHKTPVKAQESGADELTEEEEKFMKATGQTKEFMIKARALSALGKVN